MAFKRFLNGCILYLLTFKEKDQLFFAGESGRRNICKDLNVNREAAENEETGGKQKWTETDKIRTHLGKIYMWQPWQERKLKTTLLLKSRLSFQEAHLPSSVPRPTSLESWPLSNQVFYLMLTTTLQFLLCVDLSTGLLLLHAHPLPRRPHQLCSIKRWGNSLSTFPLSVLILPADCLVVFVRVRWQN